MLYLLYGPDEFARSEALAGLRSHIPADLADLNITTIDGRKLKLDTLVNTCEAMPFLTDHRLVIVIDAIKHTKAGKERDELRTYLERIPATCHLIFVERETVDKRSTIFTYLKKKGDVQEFQPRTGSALLRWLRDRAAALDVQIDQRAAQRLTDYAGNDGRTLATELGKLASYVGRRGVITPEVIDLLVQDNHEQSLFAFIDDLSLRRRSAALRGIHALIEEGQAATYILFMLARQVRILLSVQELAAQRMRADAIAAQLQQKPFVVHKALEQVRNYRGGELEALHDRLLTLDHSIKTGRLQADVALEIFVAEVCQEEEQKA